MTLISPLGSFARFAVLAVAIPLAACSSSEVVSHTTSMNYTAMQPIRLNAAKVDVTSEYQPRGAAPSIDHMMTRNPQSAVVDWARGRLRPAGTAGYVKVHIKDASVTSRVLDQDGGLQGYFTREQAEELVAHLETEISGENRDTGFSAYTIVTASHVLTVPENASSAERQAIEADLINKLMAEFNEKAEAGVRTHLAPMLAQ